MFKFNKKKKAGKKSDSAAPLFYFDEILDMLDIAKGAFFKNNEPFILIISCEQHEDVLQIINRKMAPETVSETNEFGISLCLEFDKSEAKDVSAISKLKQHKSFGSFIKTEDDDLVYFTIVLPHDSELAANICSTVMVDVFGNKKNDTVRGDFYDIEN